MLENIKENRVEYFILFVAISVFMFFIYTFRFNRQMLILLSGLGSSFYIIWGIIHQWLRGKLSRNVIYEYALFGILVFLLFFSFFLVLFHLVYYIKNLPTRLFLSSSRIPNPHPGYFPPTNIPIK